MNFQETLEFLFTMLPMYQRIGKAAYKKDLTNTLELLSSLGDPHKTFKSVHIAGTNGKGTSAHGIAAILQSAGYKTGLYTSPHLKDFTERIKINGAEISEKFVIEFVDKLKSKIEQIRPSFFETTVAMAFQYFAKEKVDIAIIETGLGGRLDSTNVIVPEACLITNIGLDHTDMLGDSLEKIAIEKAGIMKQEVPVVLGQYQEDIFHVFQERSDSLRAELVLPKIQKDEIYPPDFPYYKVVNKPGIVGVIEELNKKGWKVSDEAVNTGLTNLEVLTGFKGRFQILENSPLVIADVSHNKEGLEVLFAQIKNLLTGRLHLIFGTVKDKELGPIFKLFPENTNLFWTQSMVPRALPVSELNAMAQKHGLGGDSFQDVNSAIASAKAFADKNDTILITGSTFVIAEVDYL